MLLFLRLSPIGGSGEGKIHRCYGCVGGCAGRSSAVRALLPRMASGERSEAPPVDGEDARCCCVVVLLFSWPQQQEPPQHPAMALASAAKPHPKEAALLLCCCVVVFLWARPSAVPAVA